MVMKKTDLGLFPIDWSVSDWSSVLDGFTSGATPSRAIKDYFKGNIRWITSGELNYNIIIDTIEHISKDAVKRTNLTVHPPGTFLMAITGLEAEGTRGSCGIIGKESTTNQSCLAIYGTSRLMIPYLFYFYVKYGDWLAKHYCQGTKQQSYTASLVKQLPIIYPPSIEEQRCITEVLSDVDNLISSLQKLIEKKKAIKQGAMQELLTGKKRLPGFSGEWEKNTLKQICEFINGRAYSQHELLSKGKYKVLRLGNLFTNSHWYYTDLELNEKQYCEKGDLLYAWSASFGPTIWDGEKSVFHYHIWKIKCSEIIDKKYLYHFLNADVSSILNELQGGTMSHLTKENMENRLCSYPNLDEQQAIAKVLSDMDCEVEQLEKKLAKYQQIKQGMMQELLTGRIRLV